MTVLSVLFLQAALPVVVVLAGIVQVVVQVLKLQEVQMLQLAVALLLFLVLQVLL